MSNVRKELIISGRSLNIDSEDTVIFDVSFNNLLESSTTIGLSSYDFILRPIGEFIDIFNVSGSRIDDVQLFIDGMLIDEGYIEVNEIVYDNNSLKEVNVSYFGSVFRWKEPLKNIRLLDLPIPLFENNLDYVSKSINQNRLSERDKVWTYGLCNLSGGADLSINGYTNIFSSNCALPVLKLSYVIKKIYEALGLEVVGNLLDDKDFDSYHITPNMSDYIIPVSKFDALGNSEVGVVSLSRGQRLEDGSTIRENTFYRVNPFTFVAPLNEILSVENGFLFNRTEADLELDINLDLTITCNQNTLDSAPQFRLCLYPDIDNINSSFESVVLDIPLTKNNNVYTATLTNEVLTIPKGKFMAFQIRVGKGVIGVPTLSYTFTDINMEVESDYNNQVLLSYYLPDVSCFDYLEEIKKLFLFTEIPKIIDKTINVNFLKGLYSKAENLSEDYSLRFDKSEPYVKKNREFYENISKRRIFKWNNEFNNFILDIPKGLNIEDDDIEFDFDGADNINSLFKIVSLVPLLAEFRRVAFLDGGVGNTLVKVYYRDLEFDYGTEDLKADSPIVLNTLDAPLLLNSTFDDIVNVYHNDIIRVISEGGDKWLLTLKFDLEDIIKINDIKIIYINDTVVKGFFYILKIEEFDGESEYYKTELIKL